jgi:hypothetical protein
MRAHWLYTALALALTATLALAGETEWRRYAIPSTGTSVEMPVTIFVGKKASPCSAFRHIPSEEKPAARHHL